MFSQCTSTHVFLTYYCCFITHPTKVLLIQLDGSSTCFLNIVFDGSSTLFSHGHPQFSRIAVYQCKIIQLCFHVLLFALASSHKGSLIVVRRISHCFLQCTSTHVFNVLFVSLLSTCSSRVNHMFSHRIVVSFIVIIPKRFKNTVRICKIVRVFFKIQFECRTFLSYSSTDHPHSFNVIHYVFSAVSLFHCNHPTKRAFFLIQ
jgi:hypothetical protein